MNELSFNIPLSGTISVENNKLTITINQSETTLDLTALTKKRRISLNKGQTVFDIVLQAAQRVVEANKRNRFSAAELYHEALKEYPDLKRNSWSGHIIASAPNHPSYDHFATKKDYFKYLGNGIYKIDNRYLKIEEDDLEEA